VLKLVGAHFDQGILKQIFRVSDVSKEETTFYELKNFQ